MISKSMRFRYLVFTLLIGFLVPSFANATVVFGLDVREEAKALGLGVSVYTKVIETPVGPREVYVPENDPIVIEAYQRLYNEGNYRLYDPSYNGFEEDLGYLNVDRKSKYSTEEVSDSAHELSLKRDGLIVLLARAEKYKSYCRGGCKQVVSADCATSFVLWVGDRDVSRYYSVCREKGGSPKDCRYISVAGWGTGSSSHCGEVSTNYATIGPHRWTNLDFVTFEESLIWFFRDFPCGHWLSEEEWIENLESDRLENERRYQERIKNLSPHEYLGASE